MRTIASLFGKSPFIPLQDHMEIVARCVDQIPDLFEAYYRKDVEAVAGISKKISKEEHQADLVKDQIRNNLRRSLFMPVNRTSFLTILSSQDDIADKAENIGVLLAFKITEIPDGLKLKFDKCLDKNLETFQKVREIVGQLDELLETSFGGSEATKVLGMVGEVAHMEYEADLIQRDVLQELLQNDQAFTHGDFWLWTRIIRQVSYLSDLAENLANSIRSTLEFK